MFRHPLFIDPLARPLLLLALGLSLIACGEKEPSSDDSADDPLVDGDGDGHPAATDCDDSDASVFPGAEEACDEVDQDCDGAVDEDAVDTIEVYTDGDGDGFGAGDPVTACALSDGFAESAEDCDDADGAVFPGADERCDGADEDCDGDVDESPIDGGVWYDDDDGDGYGDANNPRAACEQPADTITDGSDCDDDDSAVNPEGAETCNDYDDDCDGLVDDEDDSVDPSTFSVFYPDGDGDGYGDSAGATVEACAQPSGTTTSGSDCDDSDASINPGATEVWYDGVNQDCRGSSDFDADSDGEDSDEYGGEDCDDTDSAVNPGADESGDCDDPIDYNCDGSVGYDDLDGDGWVACLDCDDLNADAYPYAWEDQSDGVDNDCDGRTDAADRDSPTQLSLQNDDATRESLSNFTFPFCGSSHSRLYINSNGVISFDGSVLDYSESEGQFLGSSGEGPLIAALWDDLDPDDAAADGVYMLESSDSLVIWWREVPESGARTLNDITLVLFDDGRFLTSYPALYATDGIIGWSCGDNSGADEIDLSAAWTDRVNENYGLGTGTDDAVFEHFKSSDNDAHGAAWFFCGNDGSDGDGDGWTDVCGDSDDADAAVYPQ